MRVLVQTPRAIRQRELYAASNGGYNATSAKRRKKNHEAYRAYEEARKEQKAAYYQANREILTEKQRKRARSKRSYLKHYPGQLLRGAKARAKEAGLEFDLTESDIIVPATCPVFGFPLIPGAGIGRMREASPSIDRIDPNKGYTKDNIVVISWKANRLKSNATIDEMRALLGFYEKLTASKGAST